MAAFTNNDLDISLYFDLTNGRLRIQDNSGYAAASPAISPANIAGVYKLTDPNSNILHENTDYDNPDVEPGTSLYSAYVNFTAVDGVYTLIYSVYDSNTATEYTKTFTYTYDADEIPEVTISVESDVGLATISSTDETPFTASKVLNTRTHTLTYPASWGSTSTTSILVDNISLTELYTGAYVTTITSTVTITGTDDLIIDATITGTSTHNVWDVDGYYAVRTALNTFYNLWQTYQTSNPKKGREYATIWNEINANYTMYNSYKQNGDVENAGNYLNNIKTLLAAENIDTDIDPSVSVPVTQVIPGYASQWLSGTSVPSASVGRVIDFYVRTNTNQYYSKASGSWVVIGVVGANTLIQFSDTGGSESVSWSSTYANGDNYIRFSGDGGLTYTNPAKFIDGYIYFAYASDASGSDFICTDQTGFSFDNTLEYVAEKKFDREYVDELSASDFSGYFVKYRDNGYSFSFNPGTVLIVADADGNNAEYSNVDSEIRIYQGDLDKTDDFVLAKGTVSDADGTLLDNILTVTSISADTGYIEITCSKTGVDTLTARIYVKKIKKGQAVIDITSIDDDTIKLNGSDKIYTNILSLLDKNNTLYKISDSTGVAYDANNYSLPNITWLDDDRMAYMYGDGGGSYIACVQYASDTWSIVGTPISINASPVSALQGFNMSTLTENKIAVHATTSGSNDRLVTYSFNGSTWSIVGNVYNLPYGSGSYIWLRMVSLDTENIVIVGSYLNNLVIGKYNFNGTDWALVGNELVTAYSNDGSGCSIDMLDDSTIIVYNGRSTPKRFIKFSFDGTDWSADFIYTFDKGTYAQILYLGNDELLIFNDTSNVIENYKLISESLIKLSNTYSKTISEYNLKPALLPNGLIAISNGGVNGVIELFGRFKSL